MADLPIIDMALYAQTDAEVVRGGKEDNFLALDLSTGRSWTANGDEWQGAAARTRMRPPLLQSLRSLLPRPPFARRRRGSLRRRLL